MKIERLINHIVNWLDNYCYKAKFNGFIIGISGGIDSAVTSTLCAKTQKTCIVVSLPISQSKNQIKLASTHISWLKNRFDNIINMEIDLTNIFKTFKNTLKFIDDDLSMANSRSRIRMMTLYALATNKKMLVVGTGNKIEDFGIGFFTKYGDGGVDISPIGELMKSEIYTIGKFMNIDASIIEAVPTDGLWDDNRCDESQIGATYDELEWAMKFKEKKDKKNEFKKRHREILAIYNHFKIKNLHKMTPIPVCKIPDDLLAN